MSKALKQSSLQKQKTKTENKKNKKTESEQTYKDYKNLFSKLKKKKKEKTRKLFWNKKIIKMSKKYQENQEIMSSNERNNQ